MISSLLLMDKLEKAMPDPIIRQVKIRDISEAVVGGGAGFAADVFVEGGES
jgi:hypothetical protein